MRAITEILSEIVGDAFEACGYDRSLGAVTVSDRLDLCQFQCNGAFGGAKLYKKAPLVIAGEVAARLREQGVFSGVEAVKPGFLNLVLDDRYLIGQANAMAADPFVGVPQAEQPETIVIDYGGPNVAKPLHIGHLRSAIIGEALKRLARATGNTVYGDVHFGDWGLPIGLVLAELEARHPDWRCFAPDFDPAVDSVPALDVDTLNEVYPFASAKSKQDAAFAARAHEMTVLLQSGRPGNLALWKEIMRVSVADVRRIYDVLGVQFDLWYGESDADRYIPELLSVLQTKGLMRESDGAQVVDVAEETDKAPMPPLIVKKSDGSSTYATTDLATLLQRQQDYAPQRVWYVVDKRQLLHFTQVFRCAKKAGLAPPETELAHFGFGTLNGSDGKPFKTRDGGVMRLSDLLETVIGAAAEKLAASAFVQQDDDGETARRVGIAAVKFGDLSNQLTKDYIFDIDKFLSFEGKTGTYLLYTVTRINSILKKAGVDQGAPMLLRGVYGESERTLLLKLLLTGDVFRKAMEEKAPSNLCDSAYQLAAAFSGFYHDCRIIDEPDEQKRASWLALAALTRRALCKHLDVLGIETVENM